MSKNRYYNYANPTNETVTTPTYIPDVEPESIPEPIPTPEVEQIIGTVVDCKALNVRENADADSEIVCVIPVGSKLLIDDMQSTNEWLSVCTEAGLEGYCMRIYVSIDE